MPKYSIIIVIGDVIMRYKTINEQNEIFISILKQNNDLMTILEYISKLELPNFYKLQPAASNGVLIGITQ